MLNLLDAVELQRSEMTLQFEFIFCVIINQVNSVNKILNFTKVTIPAKVHDVFAYLSLYQHRRSMSFYPWVNSGILNVNLGRGQYSRDCNP